MPLALYWKIIPVKKNLGFMIVCGIIGTIISSIAYSIALSI
jgi:hypothetical protein